MTTKRTRKADWRHLLLTLACVMTIVAYHREGAADRRIANDLSAFAEAGGGILVVGSLIDCLAITHHVRSALELHSDALTVQALVIVDAASEHTVDVALEEANRYYEHRAVSLASVMPIIQYTGTPMALSVTETGVVRAAASLSTEPEAAIVFLVETLM